VLKALDARRAYTFLHPTIVADHDKPSSLLPDPVVEFPFETTRAVHSLAASGALNDLTRIRWQLAHCGGLVPPLAGRITSDAPGDATAALRRMRYDTALATSAPALAAARETTSVDNIVFGTDWPFSSAQYLLGDPTRDDLEAAFTPGELLRVRRTNILRELPRLATAIGAEHV
jgi:predicted TIM-barrel fold metal-dependent hydrolase